MHAGSHPPRGERGVALVVVLVLVLLTTLLVLWTSRSARFNEIITGNDSDHQRAFEAAQAMVRDAEFDIQGLRPDGQPCSETTGAACRGHAVSASAALAHFPHRKEPDLNATLMETLDAEDPSCIAGICSPTAVEPEFWTDANEFTAMKAMAATYGKYTGAQAVDTGNPLLKDGTAARAWYWVELLPYDTSAAAQSRNGYDYRADADQPFVYRITAIAEGLRPGTQAVVQTIYVRRTVDD